MPEIYFHLDDTDVRNILLAENGQKAVIKKQKPKTFNPIICEVCNSENNQQNPICWNCAHIFDEKKFMVAKLTEPEKISELEIKNKELNEKIDNLNDTLNKVKKDMVDMYKLLEDSTYKHSY